MERVIRQRLVELGVSSKSLQELTDRVPEEELYSQLDSILRRARENNPGNHGCSIDDADIHPDPERRRMLRYQGPDFDEDRFRRELLAQYPYVRFDS